MRLAHEESVVRPDRRDLAAERGGGEAEILELVNELAQPGRRHGVGAARSPARGMRGEPADVAHVVVDRVGARARLERQIVPELLEMEGSLHSPVHHSHRRTRRLYAR